jgi:hypothetical protein
MQRSARISLVLGAALLSGCQLLPATKECHRQMTVAQTALDGLDASSLDALGRGLAAVKTAESACKEAGRDEETKKLSEAVVRIQGQIELVTKRQLEREQRKRTPEQLAKLEKDGDPDCPKGQAYKPRGSDKEIRCTGMLPIDMGFAQAKKYFSARGFRFPKQEDPASLVAESGSERYVYRYKSPSDPGPARCVMIYPRPDISWQETVARLTGTSPEKLKPGGTVKTAAQTLPLAVEDTEKKVLARLGDCPS